MHYLIYKITNRLDNKFYVGKHKTENKDDGYFGSGLLLDYAVKKHGKENFVKELLFECSTEEEMNRRETDIVDEDFVARDDTYNLKLGGTGGWDHVLKNKLNQTEKMRSEASRIGKTGVGGKAYQKRYREDEAFRQAMREKHSVASRRWQSIVGGAFRGKFHTDTSKEKMRLSKIGKYDGEKNPAYGKHWITNGVINKLVPKTSEMPTGFSKGRV